MNVISKKIISDFVKKNSDAKDALLSWYKEAESANWETPQHIKERYRTVSFLQNNMVIFNIKGNRYRLVTKVSYKSKKVFIKWIGTHAEYDRQKF